MPDETPFLVVMGQGRKKLDEINAHRFLQNRVPLEEDPMGWKERATELSHAAICLEGWGHRGDLESMDILLNTVMAYTVAFKVAIMRERQRLVALEQEMKAA